MINLVTDTNYLVNYLQSSGFTKEQSQGVTEALTRLDLSSLSTKQDIGDVRHELKMTETRLDAKMMEYKFDTYKFMFTLSIAQAGLITALVKLIS